MTENKALFVPTNPDGSATRARYRSRTKIAPGKSMERVVPSSSTMAAGLLPDSGIDSAQALELVRPESDVFNADLAAKSYEALRG